MANNGQTAAFPLTDQEILENTRRHLALELEKAENSMVNSIQKRDEAQERLEDIEKVILHTKVDAETGEVK